MLVALRRILRPLVHILIREGVTFPTLSGVLKAVYVDVADRFFALPGKATTDSRVALLTGVHRKDVARLRGDDGDDGQHVSPSLGAMVIGRWLIDPLFSRDGQPLPLPKAAEDQPDFEDLVQAISKDVRPRALLDELLAGGSVTQGEDGLLRLTAAAHLPSRDHAKMLHYLGQNVGDHLAACAHNLMPSPDGRPPFFERALFHDGLSPAAVAELQRLAEAEIMAALLRLHHRAAELEQRDAGTPEANQRFVAGVYLFSEPQDSWDGEGR